MKKYFFYAAMAVATMASCTSEDDLTVDPEQQTPDAEDQVALNLSVSTPAMTVGSRGTGMVGFVVTAADNATKASWDSQELFITMVDQTTNEEYEEPDGTKYFSGLEFRAPKSAVNNSVENNNIRFYQNGTYGTVEADKGVLEYKYYPIVGEYTFYGWHIDDAAGTITTEFGKDATDAKQAKVGGIVINGTQDILAANTVEIPAAKPAAGEAYYAAANEVDDATYATMVDKQFSARTARNNFTPILNFEHTLARLQFFVKAGKGTDAALNYMEEQEDGTFAETERTGYNITAANWTGTDQELADYAEMLDGAIYVTGVKVLGVYDNIELDLINQTAAATGAKSEAGFTLMSSPEVGATDKNLVPLKPVAPKYAANYTTIPSDYEADKVGESIMFLPVAEQDATTSNEIGTNKFIQIEIQLGQCLIKTEDETVTGDAKYKYYWDTPKPAVLTLDASKIVAPGETDPMGVNGVFEAGKSYNVYVTIYGRERIEVSANLVPWVEGGDIETDIEDGI